MTEAIIILGMHRSGTSCLTGCLRSFGLNLGKVSTFNQYNQKGNQENHFVFRFNEALLKAHGGSWMTPPDKEISMSEEQISQLQNILNKYAQLPKPWGIKDPRMVLTYGLWEQYLPDHRLMGTFRHPLAVAESLLSRKAFPVPLEKGLGMWSEYNARLIRQHRKTFFPIINFDETEEVYNKKVKKMAEQIGLKSLDGESFFESKLRNQKRYGLAECPEHLRPQYIELLDLAV